MKIGFQRGWMGAFLPKGGCLTLAALTLAAQPAWAIPGQTADRAATWIRNNPTLNPASNESLTINRAAAPGQRFTFQSSVFPISGVSPAENRRQIRTERFVLVDYANPITVDRLEESLREIYGQEIFNDYRQATVLIIYPARGAKPDSDENLNLVLRGEVRQGDRFAYWKEIAYDPAGTAYLGRMAVFLIEDLPLLQAQLQP